MNNFEKVAASPEMLGAFLASLHVATGPWDESFHRTFCDSCEREDCDEEHCPHQDKRNNPTWWLMQTANGKQAAQTIVWRNGRMELEPGAVIAHANPLRVYIRAARHESQLAEMLDGENARTRLDAAWQTVEEVKKVHPNAKISVEVEV